MTDKMFISELTAHCNDMNFQDFPKSLYEMVLLKAKREVARKYRILNRYYVFKYNNEKDKKEYSDIKLDLPYLIAEYKVKVNKREMLFDEKLREDYTYYLVKLNNEILFNYRPRTESDIIEIYYTSEYNTDELEIDGIKPILPEEYDEEIISIALNELAKIGLSKFPDPNSDRYKKYANILKLNTKQVGLKSELVKSDNWIQIQPKGVI